MPLYFVIFILILKVEIMSLKLIQSMKEEEIECLHRELLEEEPMIRYKSLD